MLAATRGGGKSYYKISNLLNNFVFNRAKSVIRNVVKPIVVAGSIALATTTIAFSHNLERFQCDNGKYGFRNSITKEQVIDCQYDYVGGFREGLAPANIGGKYDDAILLGILVGGWGFIDTTGKEITDMKYDLVGGFREGLAMVKLNDKWGFIDTTGTVRIDFKYDWVNLFREGLAMVKLNDKWSFIDTTGKEITDMKYDLVCDFHEGFAVVKLNDKWSFIDKTGKEITDMKYDVFDNYFHEGYAKVGIRDSEGEMKYGFVDTTGKVIIDIKYDEVDYFSEGLAPVFLNGYYGFIDTTGREIIDFKYDRVGSFRKGFAQVSIRNPKCEYHTFFHGFIDKTGKEVIPIEYDDIANEFSEGLAMVSLNGKYGFIDTNGKVRVDIKYEYEPCGDCLYPSFHGGVICVGIRDSTGSIKYGLIDTNGKEITDFKYDACWDTFATGVAVARVRLGNEEFCIDKQGNRVDCDY